jgi:hypothetical protein
MDGSSTSGSQSLPSKDYEAFRLAMLNIVVEGIEQLPKEKLAELGQNYLYQLFGQSAPAPAAASDATADPGPIPERVRISSRLYPGFIEIMLSFQTLQDIPIYMRRYPPKLSPVGKVGYLRYHLENYLNEVYILRERLKTFRESVQRAYRQETGTGKFRQQFDSLKTVISHLNTAVKIRGFHVHETRFSDPDLEKLERMAVLIIADAHPIVSVLFDEDIRRLRKEWIGALTKHNDTIQQMLDFYFGSLSDVVFDAQGRLRVLPTGARTTVSQAITGE